MIEKINYSFQKLNVTSVLERMSIPITALRYPSTLKHLEISSPSNEPTEEQCALINIYPNLTTINQRGLRDIRAAIRAIDLSRKTVKNEDDEDVGFGLFD